MLEWDIVVDNSHKAQVGELTLSVYLPNNKWPIRWSVWVRNDICVGFGEACNLAIAKTTAIQAAKGYLSKLLKRLEE